MSKLRYLKLGIGALLISLSLAPAARADFGDALLGAAVGAGISAAVDDDDDDVVYRRQYRSFSPYGYRSWRGATPVYRYRSFAPGLPFGAAYFVDQGGYRNYKDAYGNHIGRERIRW